VSCYVSILQTNEMEYHHLALMRAAASERQAMHHLNAASFYPSAVHAPVARPSAQPHLRAPAPVPVSVFPDRGAAALLPAQTPPPTGYLHSVDPAPSQLGPIESPDGRTSPPLPESKTRLAATTGSRSTVRHVTSFSIDSLLGRQHDTLAVRKSAVGERQVAATTEDFHWPLAASAPAHLAVSRPRLVT